MSMELQKEMHSAVRAGPWPRIGTSVDKVQKDMYQKENGIHLLRNAKTNNHVSYIIPSRNREQLTKITKVLLGKW